ncbi:MAG TPA: hypothetical protein VGZ47_07295 [Gemmataceae bacterium]|jgi:hypothetical protein|nr:hypothetical protein [Gemmataceae bacterium]
MVSVMISCTPAALGNLFVLAYGPVPGMELVPYFLALLAWAALAIISIFLSPITALLRRLRKGKNVAAEAEVEPAAKSDPSAGNGPAVAS